MSDGARYRRLYANEWHDPAFRRLDDSARVVRLYVSAGPQTTSAGCFRLSSAVAVEDLGGSAEDFERRLEHVCEAFNWAWNPLARVIWITNWFDLNQPANPNVVNAWAKLLRNVPDCDVKTQAIVSISKSLKDLPASFRAPWLELSKSFPVTESKAQSRTESIQGSGIREFKKQGAGALARGGAVEKNNDTKPNNLPEVENWLIRIADEVIREGPRQATTDELVNLLQYHCRERNLEVPKRAQALIALTKSQAERSA